MDDIFVLALKQSKYYQPADHSSTFKKKNTDTQKGQTLIKNECNTCRSCCLFAKKSSRLYKWLNIWIKWCMYTVQIQRYLINTTRPAALRAKRQQRFLYVLSTLHNCVYIFSNTFSSKRGNVRHQGRCVTNTGESRVLKKYIFASYIYIFNKIYIYLKTQWAVQFYQKTVDRFQVDTWRHWRGSSEKTSSPAAALRTAASSGLRGAKRLLVPLLTDEAAAGRAARARRSLLGRPVALKTNSDGGCCCWSHRRLEAPGCGSTAVVESRSSATTGKRSSMIAQAVKTAQRSASVCLFVFF